MARKKRSVGRAPSHTEALAGDGSQPFSGAALLSRRDRKAGKKRRVSMEERIVSRRKSSVYMKEEKRI